MVVKGGEIRRTLEWFRFMDWVAFRVDPEFRRVRSDRLCARVLDRRSVARNAAVTSGEGASPNMKNFMNAPMRITIDSWPRRRPWVKERLGKWYVSFVPRSGLETY